MPFAQIPALAVVAVILAFIFLLLSTTVFVLFFSTWLQALLSGVPLRVLDLIGMRLRRTDIKAVVRSLIMAKQGGVVIPWTEMEAAWAQGVDLEKVVLAIIQANKENMDITFQDLVDAELENRLSGKLDENNTAYLEEVAV
jgi:uncharacterized protein YqfA (UPF0365 family)